MNDTVFEITQWIDAPADVVFEYFVDPEKLVEWMGLSATVDAVEGGAWRITFPGGIETWGTFLELTPPSRLRFTWGSRALDGRPPAGGPGLTTAGDSIVEITLSERGTRTLLSLKHSGFATAERVDIGWHAFIGALASLLAGRI